MKFLLLLFIYTTSSSVDAEYPLRTTRLFTDVNSEINKIAIPTEILNKNNNSQYHLVQIIRNLADSPNGVPVFEDSLYIDGMIESVVMGEDDVLTITWNTDAGIEKTEINFGKYIDSWTHRGATKGIAVEGDNYVGVVDPDSESYLTVGEKGFKIEGIDDINEQV